MLVVALAALTSATTTAAQAQLPEPTITVSPAAAEPGGRVLVWLDHWPLGVVTVQVCGNNVQRGSQDCDNVGARSIPVRDDTTVQFQLLLTAPPVGCPCVIRAATSGNDVVRAAPIDLIGVPGNTDIAPNAGLAESSTVAVRADVVDQEIDFPSSWYSRFGGDAKKNLVLRITNKGSTPLTNLRVAGQVGRKAGSGEPISAPVEGEIVPGERRTVVVPFDVSAPAWGDYVVSGSVYGLAQPLRFRTDTNNDPWALELAVIVFVVVLALLARRRERKARERAALAGTGTWVWVPLAPVMVPPAPPMTEANGAAGAPSAPPLEAEPVVDLSSAERTESSPDVERSYDPRCEPNFYDHGRQGNAPVNGDGVPTPTNGARSASPAQH